MRVRRLLLRAVMIPIFACVGSMLGASEAERTSRGSHIEWEPVPLPAGNAPDHFVLGEGALVFVLTREGKLFARHLDTPRSTPGWQEIDEEDFKKQNEEMRGPCDVEGTYLQGSPISEPPGQVVHVVECSYSPHAEAYDLERYVILEDGSVWLWERQTGLASGFGAFILLVAYGVLYGGAGALVGWVGSFVLEWSLRLVLRARRGRSKL